MKVLVEMHPGLFLLILLQQESTLLGEWCLCLYLGVTHFICEIDLKSIKYILVFHRPSEVNFEYTAST